MGTVEQKQRRRLFRDYFPAENGRWVPALPYRRKPAWYGKRDVPVFVSDVTSFCVSGRFRNQQKALCHLHVLSVLNKACKN
jgi:hypothetical protein